jgi:hypothetical protein
MHKAALEEFERALKIERVIHGENHDAVALRLTQLGRLFQEMDNNPGAERCFKRARQIRDAAAVTQATQST